MNLKFIYLSAERKNELLTQEIKNGIQAITKEDLVCSISNQIAVVSISIKGDTNSNSGESTVLETSHSLQEKDDLHLQEEDTLEVSEEVEIHMNDFYKLAEYLHCFADANFESGRTSVHIFWCVKNYIPCPSEVVEFYGVFERLGKWFNASLNVVTNNFDVIEDWLSFLPIRVVNKSEEVIKNIFSTVWSGSLAFSIEGNSGLTLYPDVVLRCENKSSDLFIFSGLKNVTQPLYVLPVAEVFSEVDLDSIPLSFIQRGSLCTLLPSPQLGNDKREEAVGILSSVSSTAGVGTLLRIRFSDKPPSMKGLEANNTQTWKQMVAEGNFNLNPGLIFEGRHEVAVFLILPKRPGIESVQCVALQDPANYGEDVVELILQEQLKSPVKDESQKKKILDLLNETLAFSRLQTDAFSRLLSNLPDIVKKPLKKISPSIETLPRESLLALEWAMSKEILSNPFFHPTSPVQVRPPNCTVISESLAPKECWPEFRALEEAEKKKKNSILRCTSGDFLCGLSPPAPSRKDNCIDVPQLLKSYYKYRTDKGRVEGPTTSSCGGGNGKFDWLRKKSWREALPLKHFGIYYNLGRQQERLELMCGRLREQMLRCETASTCTLFRSQESAYLPQVERKNRKQKEGRSQFPLPKASFGKECAKTDGCSVASDLQSLRLKPKNGPSTQASGKTSEPQPRRSPRKRVREQTRELKPSDLLCKKNVPSKGKTSPVARRRSNPKPAELSELHKQKLRNAIASCLEGEDITMKDPLFMLCFKKMFAVCKPFALDVADQGGTRRSFEKIAKSHVKQVVQFEKRKKRRK